MTLWLFFLLDGFLLTVLCIGTQHVKHFWLQVVYFQRGWVDVGHRLLAYWVFPTGWFAILATVLWSFTAIALMLLVLYIRDDRLLIWLNVFVGLQCFSIFRLLWGATPAIVFRRSPAICFRWFLRLLPCVKVLIQAHGLRLVRLCLLIAEECICLFIWLRWDFLRNWWCYVRFWSRINIILIERGEERFRFFTTFQGSRLPRWGFCLLGLLDRL